jgi:hypothetical protein
MLEIQSFFLHKKMANEEVKSFCVWGIYWKTSSIPVLSGPIRSFGFFKGMF